MKYEKWSVGYWVLKQYVRFASWIILKRTIITGKENIPDDKPIVFVPNHQNALSDPMAVLLNTKYQPVWLARADIFGKHKITDTILQFMKIIPVYRLRDGKENLDKNQQTFSVSIKVLENNSALALFPEAGHTFKRQMVPHKKAVPRIVFMAEEQTDNKLDIQIIPTGINYSHFWKFNRTLIVNFGKPIPVSEYLESYSQNPNIATIDLKAKIHNALLPLVLNIKSKKHYDDFEKIREIYGNYFLDKQNLKPTELNRFHSDRQLIKLLDRLEKKEPLGMETICAEADNVKKQILALKLRPWLLDAPDKLLQPASLNTFLLLTSFPLFIYGFLLNAIPFYFIDRFVKNKIKDKSFWSSFFLVGGITIYPLYCLLLLLPLTFIISNIWISVLIILSLPFAGKVAFKWYILFRKTSGMVRLIRLKHFNKRRYRQLLDSRTTLFEKIDAILQP